MGVTTVLVPVSEPEAEALLEGRPVPELLPRARVTRARVARVDAIREELHELLFPRWAAARHRPNPLLRLASVFRSRSPAAANEGYDPFVQLFGRSLPFDGNPKRVAEQVVRALASDDAAFEELLATSLAGIDARAGQLFREAKPPEAPPELASAIDDEARAVAEAMGRADVCRALDGLARLFAWSFPVWRLDGEMLPELLRELGLETVAGRASALFEEVAESRPDVTAALPSLPEALPDFARAGAFLSSAEVRLVAGALRLRRGQIARNVAQGAEFEAIAMRNARLLEEAVLFCEARSLALLEGAGVEWHDRQAKKTRATS